MTTLKTQQQPEPRRRHVVALVTFLVFTQAFPAFATDMYTPALPSMATSLNTSDGLVNLSVTGFFLFQIMGMLVLGPLSDRLGRRPILLGGCACFCLASILCFLASNIVALLAARMIQALAAGGTVVVGMAVVRDLFEGKLRENVLLWMQAISVIGPIAAPLVGGQILLFTSWHAVFIALGILGAIGLTMSIFFRESLTPELRVEGAVHRSFIGLVHVLRDRRFMHFALMTMLSTALSFMAYITLASYVYETTFGFTPQQYSLAFGLTAAVSVFGIPLYKLVSRWVSKRNLIWTAILVTLTSGIATFAIGWISPWVFFVCMVFVQVFNTMTRPFCTNIQLGMCTRDVGSASSVLNCTYNLIGIIGVLPLLVLQTGYLVGIGVLLTIGSMLALVLWVRLLRSGYEVPGIKEASVGTPPLP